MGVSDQGRGGFTLLHRARKAKVRIALAALLATGLGAKTCSYATHRPAHSDPAHPAVRADLVDRGRYLAGRTTALSTGQMPGLLGDQFQGEWLVVTRPLRGLRKPVPTGGRLPRRRV